CRSFTVLLQQVQKILALGISRARAPPVGCSVGGRTICVIGKRSKAADHRGRSKGCRSRAVWTVVGETRTVFPISRLDRMLPVGARPRSARVTATRSASG